VTVERVRSRTAVPVCVALASALAGLIHLAVVPEHLEEWWVYGTFFVVTGVFQLGYAVAVLRRPTPLVALTGIITNLGIVLLWLLSRTTGLPVGPPADRASHEGAHLAEGGSNIEAVGPLDLVASGAELVVVYLLVTLLPPPLRKLTVNVLLVVGVGLWALRMTGALG